MMRLLPLMLLMLASGMCRADNVPDYISGRLVKNEMTEGRFRQEKRIRVLKKPLISTGVFTYHPNRGVIWKTLTPAPSLLLVGRERLMTGQNEQKMPPAFGKVFTAMLGGDLQPLTENFDISSSTGKESWLLSLKPKDEMMQKIIAGIQLSGDKSVREVEIRETNGNFTRIEFDHIAHPKALTAEQEADFERLSSPR